MCARGMSLLGRSKSDSSRATASNCEKMSYVDTFFTRHVTFRVCGGPYRVLRGVSLGSASEVVSVPG